MHIFQNPKPETPRKANWLSNLKKKPIPDDVHFLYLLLKGEGGWITENKVTPCLRLGWDVLHIWPLKD